MTQITEDYVSFETAKLLKEKGFNESTSVNYYVGDGKPRNCTVGEMIYRKRYEKDVYLIACPTLQMAMKWLREVYNLHCVVDYDFVLGWYCQITSLKETVEYDYEEMKHYHPDKDNGFSSPEEACEAAIKYCLENLI